MINEPLKNFLQLYFCNTKFCCLIKNKHFIMTGLRQKSKKFLSQNQEQSKL